ncbi:tagaturonate epimerase family protein [Paenibacillus oceani]|uniref:Tagaturonate/fructuronate epimerase n=1 Tax=Paenibacillus oceani TaxID=2772510 RepID=A0A927CC74_9BACL|nr:tagaturonate epimerase family protein [Paenibacillus oceani]MBD2863902.1 tagaturonate epimerase family protein [Paenibacillus oceani]
MQALLSVIDTLQAAGSVVKTYERSLAEYEGVSLVMIKRDGRKLLLAQGAGALADALEGEAVAGGADSAKLCPLTHANRLTLNRFFPYTAPRAFGTQISTIGLGDRLGIASSGHIETVRGHDIRPILAQQSIRELNLTGRDYKEVLDAACYAAFQEGYKDGFGADGDHLKVEADIELALGLGFTMLTLDCSEHIDNTVEGQSDADILASYAKVPADVRSRYEDGYLNRNFEAAGTGFVFNELTLAKNVLIYAKAIDYMEHVFTKYIQTAGRDIDFEVSIDETLTPTDPGSHFLIAEELYRRGVKLFSMAPRFCGEFQKGIDYIGDVARFEEELKIHAAIADHFGYKLSIHSGSDKFTVFPMIGVHTKGRFHLKTAGTNWLEAMRVIAKTNPGLYRRMHTYAYDHFEEATAYYHVKADLNVIKPLESVADSELPDYLNDDDARQMLHITYGILLQAKDESDKSLFKDEFYRTMDDNEPSYTDALITHIGKHVKLLGK